MTPPVKIPTTKAGNKPEPPTFEVDALTTRPTRPCKRKGTTLIVITIIKIRGLENKYDRVPLNKQEERRLLSSHQLGDNKTQGPLHSFGHHLTQCDLIWTFKIPITTDYNVKNDPSVFVVRGHLIPCGLKHNETLST